MLLDLTAGEAFVTGFIFLAVVTAQYFPRVGAAAGRLIAPTRDAHASAPPPG